MRRRSESSATGAEAKKNSPRSRRASFDFTDEFTTKPEAPIQIQPASHLHGKLCEWPCTDYALPTDTLPEIDHTALISPKNLPIVQPAQSSGSSIVEPAVHRPRVKSAHEIQLTRAAHNTLTLIEVKTAHKPSDADVVKRLIDPMHVNIPMSPFPKSGRWSFEQLNTANIAMAAAIKTKNEELAKSENEKPVKTPDFKLLSTTTEIEQNMARYGMGDGFIRDFARHETFDNLAARYSKQCGDLAAFVSRYYPKGVPTAASVATVTPATSVAQPSRQSVPVTSPTPDVPSAPAPSPTPDVPSAPAPPPTLDEQLPQELIDAKNSSDKDTRFYAVRNIMRIIFPVEFMNAFYDNDLEEVLTMFPEDGAKYMALIKEYRARQEDA